MIQSITHDTIHPDIRKGPNVKPQLSQKALFEIRKKKAQQPHDSTNTASPLINAIRAKAGRPAETPPTQPLNNIPERFRKQPKTK